MPREQPPPPGRPMMFPEWSSEIVAGVRSFIPEARAARRGSQVVIIRHDGREAHLSSAGGSFWITFKAESVATTMASMWDDRRDLFVTRNFAKSIAGYLDARFSRP